jgi:hypothetical protein
VEKREILFTGGTGVPGHMIVLGLAVLLPVLLLAGTYGASRGNEPVRTCKRAERGTEA